MHTILGFLRAIGFQYAAITSPFDSLSHGGVIFAYLAPILISLILIAMGIQGASQLGFDAARKIADHQTAVSFMIAVIGLVAILDLLMLRRDFKWFLASIAFNIIGLVAILYASFLADQKILVWTLLFAVTIPWLLFFVLGVQSVHHAARADARTYDVHLEKETIRKVRIIRFSTSGIIYLAGHLNHVSFISTPKIVKVIQVS